VAAHSEIANIVEEDYAGGTGSIDRITEEGAYNNVGAARFVYDSGPKCIMVPAEALEAIGQRPGSQVGAAADDQTGGFPAGVGVDDPDPASSIRCHEMVNPCEALSLDRNRVNIQYLIGVAVFYGYNMQSSNLSVNG
jgi:hypothetical protein